MFVHRLSFNQLKIDLKDNIARKCVLKDICDYFKLKTITSTT